jgi:hypothetical protein
MTTLTTDMAQLKKANAETQVRQDGADKALADLKATKADKGDVGGPGFDATSLEGRLKACEGHVSRIDKDRASMDALMAQVKATVGKNSARLDKVEAEEQAHLKRTEALEAELGGLAAKLAAADAAGKAFAADMKKFAFLAGRVEVLEKGAAGLSDRVSSFGKEFEKEMKGVRPLVADTAELKRQMESLLGFLSKVRAGLDGKADRTDLDPKLDQDQTESLILKFITDNQAALRNAISCKADKQATEDQMSVISRFMKEITEQLHLDEEALNRIKGALPGKVDKKTLAELMKKLGEAGNNGGIPAAGSKPRCLSCDRPTGNLPPGGGKSSHHFRADL